MSKHPLIQFLERLEKGKTEQVRPLQGLISLFLWGLVLLSYLCLSLGGALVYAKKKQGLLIIQLVAILQMPFFRVGRFSYSVSTIPTAEWKMWGSHESPSHLHR